MAIGINVTVGGKGEGKKKVGEIVHAKLSEDKKSIICTAAISKSNEKPRLRKSTDKPTFIEGDEVYAYHNRHNSRRDLVKKGAIFGLDGEYNLYTIDFGRNEKGIHEYGTYR